MAVEKFIPGRLAHEKKNFPWTQILNDVLQNYTNARAMAVWCHLQSRSADWVVSIPNLTNHFKDIGKNQAYEIFKDLRKVNLLKRIDYKSVDGTHKLTQYIVLNGESFDNEGEFSNIECKPFEQSYSQQPLPGYQDPDYQDPDNRDYTKERDLQKKENTQKKEASLCVKIKHNKKKPSYCPGTHEQIITPEAEQIAKDKRVDVIKVCLKFQDWAKSNGWLRLDWKATFINWMQDERVNHKQTHNTPPALRDVTEERMAQELGGEKYVDEQSVFDPPCLGNRATVTVAVERQSIKNVRKHVVLGKKRSYRYKDLLNEKIGSQHK